MVITKPPIVQHFKFIIFLMSFVLIIRYIHILFMPVSLELLPMKHWVLKDPKKKKMCVK